MNTESKYNSIRSQIEHLDNSLNQRVVWLVIAQSFFFNGFAVLINGKPQFPHLDAPYKALEHIFPIAALLTVIFTVVDVAHTLTYIKDLRKLYDNKIAGTPEMTDMPPIHGYPQQRKWMYTSPILIPCLFIISWIIILVRQYGG